ncbi:MAG: hypothetical protein Q9159_007444 [Coniocarpon cinnabarinum]
MPGPTNTLLIEGSFRELVDELADYVDGLRKAQNADSPSLKEEVAPLLDRVVQTEENECEDREEEIETAKDAVLKVIVKTSGTLNTAPEREIIPSYNLLIHLLTQGSEIDPYLKPLCQTLSNPDSLTAVPSAAIRVSLTMTVLTTVFNIIDYDDGVRYPVFNTILDNVARSGTYENLRGYLKHLDKWMEEWEATPEQQRRTYLKLSQIAAQSTGSVQQQDASSRASQESYGFLLKALRTILPDDAGGDEARKLALDALRSALVSSSRFDFEDLTALDPIQALRTREPVWYQLLELFVSDSYDDFISFNDEHPQFLEQHKLNKDVLSRKIRLLTVASLAASSNNRGRALPYAQIAEALQVPQEEVEMWVIDVIRAGLVEGKLSQQRKEFLVHRATYRVFTDSQWRDVANRLDVWREGLRGVLEVVRQQKEEMVRQKEEELKSVEAKLDGVGGGRRPRRQELSTEDGIGA